MTDRLARRSLRALLAVGLVGLFAGQFLGIPLVVGFVETGSMAPTMEPGDGFVAVPPALTGGVDQGDVVTFDARNVEGGRLTTHRIVAETPDGYVTRGDANPFTDQQAGEPPVTRDRIITEALQVGGTVIVIPNLGDGVEAIRGVFAAVGAPFGLGVNQVVAFVLVAALVAYLLDESGAAGERRGERATRRSNGLPGTRLVGGAIALVILVATVSMVVGSGAITVPYDSLEPGAGGQGIAAGETANATVELRNGGLVPTTAVLATDDPNADLARERVTLGPREARTVNLSITAPSEPGRYEVTVQRYQYLAVLPGAALSTLSDAGHWLAVAAVDLVLALGVLAAGLVLVGRGRVRLRPTRDVPFEVGLVRRLRSLYRN